jgi:hypothetical protein
MSTSFGLFAALLNILSLGAGYAYCGRLFQAAATLLFSFALFFLFSYLAAFSGWFVVGGIGLVLLILVVVAFDSFRTALSPILTPHMFYAAAYVLVFLLTFMYFVFPARRVVFNTIGNTAMEPTLTAGDHFALDREFSDFKVGDVVVAELDDQSLIVRRIEQIKENTVVVTTDNKSHSQTEELPRASLHGKIVYVLYSMVPESWTMAWDRLLLPIH